MKDVVQITTVQHASRITLEVKKKERKVVVKIENCLLEMGALYTEQDGLVWFNRLDKEIVPIKWQEAITRDCKKLIERWCN